MNTGNGGAYDGRAVVLGQLLANAGMGGAENYAMLLANEHAARGGRVHVIVLSGPGPISERFAEDVEVVYLDYWRDSIRNPFRFATSVVRGYRLLAGVVKERGVQVLQTHLPDTNLWGLVLSLRGVCRVVITIHNNKFLRGRGGLGITHVLKTRAYRLMVRRCSRVVAVSAEVRASLASTLGLSNSDAGRVAVVANGVPIPPPASAGAIAIIRDRHGVGADDFWVVAAGRLTPAKDFACLVRAARRLRDAGVPVRVLIGGEGELRGDLESQVADLGLGDVVTLPGNLADLGQVMQAADVLAMPSRWEGLPLVLLEALARALPVVGTRIAGLRDIVREGEHGLLVAVEDDAALAAALERLHREPGTRAGMGLACLELARAEYDFTRVYDELADIYAAAAAGVATG